MFYTIFLPALTATSAYMVVSAKHEPAQPVDNMYTGSQNTDYNQYILYHN